MVFCPARPNFLLEEVATSVNGLRRLHNPGKSPFWQPLANLKIFCALLFRARAAHLMGLYPVLQLSLARDG